jgi:hypothetical protein
MKESKTRNPNFFTRMEIEKQKLRIGNNENKELVFF